MFCFQPYTSAPQISEVGQISIYEIACDSYPTGPSSQHQCILNGRHPVNLNCLLKVYLPYTSKENMHLFRRKKCSIWTLKTKIYVHVTDANYKNTDFDEDGGGDGEDENDDDGDENDYDDHFHYFFCEKSPH